MKKLTMMLSVLPALLFNTAVTAEPYCATKPVQCGKADEIIAISKSYGELPSVVFDGASVLPNGSAQLSKFIIATNEAKGTWTLIEFPQGSDMGCILGSGNTHVRLLTQGESI